MSSWSSLKPRLEGVLIRLLPVFAILLAFLIGAVMLLALGANPLTAYLALLDGAFGSVNALAETTVKAIPLLLVGVGITIAFRAKVINIGGEGQMVIGALAATAIALVFPDLPPVLMIPLTLLAGFVAGGLYGALPGALKAYFQVNEILSTIMLNIVAVQAMNFLLRGIMIDPKEVERGTRIPQTMRLSPSADLPILIPGTRLHAGVLIALLAAVAVYIFLWRTTLGYRIRAVGLNPDASRYAGIHVKRYVILALTLSGALAGLAGAILVFGSESHRMVTDGSTTGFTGSAGFNGIVAALFGGLHPIGTIPASFLFGALLVGANKLQRVAQVPSALITALNGLVVVFVVSIENWRGRRVAILDAVDRDRDSMIDSSDTAGATTLGTG
jgi:simple sugar transport system permease protein